MIILSELLHGHKSEDISAQVGINLSELLVKLNKVRSAYGKPMIITSGFRTPEEQHRVNPKATKSKHLTGQAADVLDRGGELKAWINSNLVVIEQAGLWMEDFVFTPSWVHFQSVPPASGKRFFIP